MSDAPNRPSAHHTDAHSSSAALLGTSVLLILLKKNYVLLIGQTPDCYFILFDILIFFYLAQILFIFH